MGVNSKTQDRVYDCSSHSIELDVTNKRLLKDGVPIELPMKALNVLHCIISAGQNAISRDELIDKVWQGNHFVGQKAVNQAIWQLRKALGDSTEEPVFIETVPKVGYRWLGTSQHQEPPVKSIQSQLLVAAILALLSLSFGVYHTIPEDTLPQLEQVYASHLPGIERSASLSFANQYIAYEQIDTQGVSRIKLTSPTLDQSASSVFIPQVPEAAVGIDQVSPSWHPTEMKLAYVKKNQLRSCEVVVYHFTSKEETHIDTCGVTWLTQVRWSPDGQFLAYSYSDHQPGTAGIRLFDINSGKTQNLTTTSGVSFFSDSILTWSPDSDAVTFITATSPTHFTVANIELNGKKSHFFDLPKPVMGATWYQNKLIYAVQNQIGSFELKSFDTHNQTHGLIPNTFGGSWFPATDPTQEYLTFSALTDYRYIGFSQEQDLGSIRSVGDNRNLQFSPDGQLSLLGSNRSGENALYLMTNNSKALQPLNIGVDGIQYPRWSHDSNTLVFNAHDTISGKNGLYLYDLRKKRLDKIGDAKVSYGPATWSQDGKHLIVANDRDNVWRLVRLNHVTGEEQRLTQHMSIFGFYLNNENVLIYVRPDIKGIWKKTPEQDPTQTSPRLILDTPRALSHFVAWDIKGTDLYVSNQNQINRYKWQEPALLKQTYQLSHDASIDPYCFISINPTGGVAATLMPPEEEDVFIFKWLQ